MPKHVIKSDRNTQWVVNKDGHTWILEKQATLDVAPGPAILIEAGFDENKIFINGDIEVDPASQTAIVNSGDSNVLTLGGKARVEGYQGITGVGDHTRVVNHGRIVADNVAIAQGSDFTLINSGKIFADFGVSVEQARLIDNRAGGVIEGGIWIFGDGQSEIVNRGVIRVGISGDAILDEDGSVKIRNMGLIYDNISLGGGSDELDSLKGEVRGEIRGGNGSDTYKISQTDAMIIEAFNEGLDTVYSNVTFTLAANVEEIFLVGRRNIDAVGNDDSDNFMRGNRGDNDLDGRNGADNLFGEEGSDRLTGGLGNDRFDFRPNADQEIILDFEDGVDRIYLVARAVQTEAQAVQRLEQHGDDVWLQANGTRMVIKDIDIGQLTEADFVAAFLP